MAAICPSCGADNPDGFAFCGRCGTKIEAATPAIEQRRLCTIVFCDLVGFTQRSESLDPEDVRQFLLLYYELMTEEVERYGGAIDKLYGDGGMAVFGVPTAHEDDPERAIRASLKVLERLPSLGLDLEARIGINTGEVVVSTDHAARGDALTGDTVNTASRIQSAAPVGGVVVGDRTYASTKHVFDYEVLEPVALKGKAEPVAIFQPTAPIAMVAIETNEATPFVGREAELQTLVTAFDRALSGEPTFLTIVAEPGMGKSRLVREFGGYVDALPDLITWRQGRCLPYGEGISFWAFGEIVKTHAGILDSDEQEEISNKLDAVLTEPNGSTRAWIKDRIAPLVGLRTTTVAPERSELFAAWRRFIAQLAAEDSLVLVVEDLHWADDVLVEFLQDLRSSFADLPILVLATARPEVAERHPGWLDGTELRLDALGAGPMRELVETTLSDAAPELVDTVCARAGGSPLYAEQLAAMRRAMPIVGGSEDDLPIPPTIQALLAARIDMLPPELLDTLLDASVIGKTFWAGAAGVLGEIDPSEARERLDQLVERSFLRTEPSSTIEGEREYAFVHALLHDVAYGRLSRRPRFAKHRATAAWIVDRVGRPLGGVAEIVIAHLDQAKDAALAAGLPDEVPAIDSALADALMDAAAHSERTDMPAALRLIERADPLVLDDDPRRTDVSDALATYANGVGDLHRGLELLEAVIPMLREAERWDDLGSALDNRASLLVLMKRTDEADEAFADAIEEMTGHPGAGLVDVLVTNAFERSRYVSDLASIERAERAVEEAGIPSPPRLVELRAGAEIEQGEIELGFRHWREAAERALEDGEPEQAALILNDLGSIQQNLGTITDAIAACDEAIAIVEERGLDPTTGRGVRAAALVHAGRWDEVAEETPGLIQMVNDRGNALQAEGLWSNLARVLIDRGQPERIDEDVFEPANFSMIGHPNLWAIHLQLEALRGDVDLEPVRRLIEADEMLGSPRFLEVLVDLGAVPLAERYRRSIPTGRNLDDWADGLINMAHGAWPEADRALVAALETLRRVGSVFVQAGLLTRLGRCAIELGDAGLARERLTEARTLWAGMKADARIAEVDRLLAEV